MISNKQHIRLVAVTALFALICLSANAQRRDFPSPISIRPDTSIVTPRTAVPDTADTSAGKKDSLQTASGIDSVVNYAATDSIVYSLSSKTMFLYGKSSIKYKELGLKAEQIDINWNSSILNAQGVADTSDTSKSGFRGLPDLIDAGETYRGNKIAYNFRTKRGKIDVGRTEMDAGFYRGEKIKKVSSDVLFVADGRYTTCDLPHPHYYFASPEMKVMLQDKIVARPIYLYISDVPILALPFGIFPTERGRR
ncbi:MAG: putative LPS assembly protein LptD, partial [bacterium]